MQRRGAETDQGSRPRADGEVCCAHLGDAWLGPLRSSSGRRVSSTRIARTSAAARIGQRCGGLAGDDTALPSSISAAFSINSTPSASSAWDVERCGQARASATQWCACSRRYCAVTCSSPAPIIVDDDNAGGGDWFPTNCAQSEGKGAGAHAGGSRSCAPASQPPRG